MEKEIAIFKTDKETINVEVLFEDETVWLTQEQMAQLFEKSKSTINEHIKNIFAEGELEESTAIKKFGNSEFQQKAPFYYNPRSDTSIQFFKKVQNKMHFAVHGQTAAEVIYNRADLIKIHCRVFSSIVSAF